MSAELSEEALRDSLVHAEDDADFLGFLRNLVVVTPLIIAGVHAGANIPRGSVRPNGEMLKQDLVLAGGGLVVAIGLELMRRGSARLALRRTQELQSLPE